MNGPPAHVRTSNDVRRGNAASQTGEIRLATKSPNLKRHGERVTSIFLQGFLWMPQVPLVAIFLSPQRDRVRFPAPSALVRAQETCRVRTVPACAALR